MKALRITALVATGLMALANIPIAFTADDADVPEWLQWPATVVGVLGMVAFVALLMRLSWAVPFALAVGVLNIIGAIVVLADGDSNGVVGLVLGAVAVLATAGLLRASTESARAA